MHIKLSNECVFITPHQLSRVSCHNRLLTSCLVCCAGLGWIGLGWAGLGWVELFGEVLLQHVVISTPSVKMGNMLWREIVHSVSCNTNHPLKQPRCSLWTEPPKGVHVPSSP